MCHRVCSFRRPLDSLTDTCDSNRWGRRALRPNGRDRSVVRDIACTRWVAQVTYIAWDRRKWDGVCVQVQSRRRLFGAELVQFLLQKKPLDLQLGSHTLRQSNLLTALLHRMLLTELVDSGQILILDWTSQWHNTRDPNSQHKCTQGSIKKGFLSK